MALWFCSTYTATSSQKYIDLDWRRIHSLRDKSVFGVVNLCLLSAHSSGKKKRVEQCVVFLHVDCHPNGYERISMDWTAANVSLMERYYWASWNRMHKWRKCLKILIPLTKIECQINCKSAFSLKVMLLIHVNSYHLVWRFCSFTSSRIRLMKCSLKLNPRIELGIESTLVFTLPRLKMHSMSIRQTALGVLS